MRKALYCGALLAFAAQSAALYADLRGRGSQLGESAIRGQKIWRERNCHACHRLHGFGGYLGPDLTNAAARLPEAELLLALDGGRGTMPRFGFNLEEKKELIAYLSSLNESGRAEPLPPLDDQGWAQTRSVRFAELPWFEFP